MFDILRESTVGELLNKFSGGRIPPYADQRPDFVIPERYLATSSSTSAPITRVPTTQTKLALLPVLQPLRLAQVIQREDGSDAEMLGHKHIFMER